MALVQKNLQKLSQKWMRIRNSTCAYTFFSILRTSDHSHANHSPPKRVPPGSPDRASVRWSWSNLKHNRIRGIRATVLINPRLNGVSIKVSGLTFYRRPRSGKPTPRSRAVERRGRTEGDNSRWQFTEKWKGLN